MTFESRLMNIPTRPASMIVGTVSAWHEGHKHARHAASEIGAEADAELTRLQAEVERMREALESIAAPAAFGMPSADRVEAFRDVARAALTGEQEGC